MLNEKRIFQIASLNLTKSERPKNEGEMKIYEEKLNKFVDGMPELQNKAFNALEKQDNAALKKYLADAAELLTNIHAKKSAKAALDNLAKLESMPRDELEAFLESFFSGAASLSISIQMAMHTSKNTDNDIPPERTSDDSDESTSDDSDDNSAPINILAVDDMAFFLNTLKTCLAGAQYKLTCVTSGAAALKALEKLTPDLFLLDIEMPVMNGFELAEKIKQKGCTAPIVFLTGNSTRQHVLRAIQAGAADFIVKPINRTEVLEKIEGLGKRC